MRRDEGRSEQPRAERFSADVTSLRVTAIVVAGGAGERFGDAGGKQLARVAGVPVVGHTVRAFVAASLVDHVVVVVHPERVEEYRTEIAGALASNLSAADSEGSPDIGLIFVAGGDSRQESVACGLDAVDTDVDLIAIHDGARPLVTPALIDEVIRALIENDSLDGLVVGHPSYDTLKRVVGADIIDTPDRSQFWVAQTPQVFKASVLRDAYRRAFEQDVCGTDDASLVEAAGGRVRMFEGPRANIKVTVASDLDIVEAALRQREEGMS